MVLSRSHDCPQLIISPYPHVAEMLEKFDVACVVSILGRTSDRLPWPDVGSRKHLRLEFDDVYYSSRDWLAPGEGHIRELVQFAREWDGSTSTLIHCKAAVSRSVAAGMIAAAAIDRIDLARWLLAMKSYYRPHRGMLSLADRLLQTSPTLIELANKSALPDSISKS